MTVPSSLTSFPGDRRNRDESGHIEAVLITRLLSPRRSDRSVDLLFAGRPVNKRGTARGVHVEFVEDGTQLPLPALDPDTHQVHLFFAKSEFKRVHGLLTSRMDRLCYFWRSMDGSRRRAWLVTTSI